MPRHLTCACCGAGTRGAQWWNRDTGFGVCPSCYAEEVARCGEAYAIECYGRPGVHHSLPERHAAPAQQAPAYCLQPADAATFCSSRSDDGLCRGLDPRSHDVPSCDYRTTHNPNKETP